MRKGWRILFVNEYPANLLGFSDDIGQLDLPIVDAATTVRTDNGDEIIIQINQALSKPYEDLYLTSTFQVRYNGTRIYTAPM